MKPYRYTMEGHELFVSMIADGATINTAASAIGVSHATVYVWLDRGEKAVNRWEAQDLDEDARSIDPDWEMAHFYQDYTVARGKHLVSCARVVTNSALGAPAQYDDKGNCIREEVKPDPRMALEILARRDRANWAREARDAQAEEAADVDLEDLARRGEELAAELAALDANG